MYVTVTGAPLGVSLLQEFDVESESEQPTARRQRNDSGSTKKSRTKRPGRKQASRSIRSLPSARQTITNAAYPFIQKEVALYLPWPIASPSGDPGADDDEIEALIENAWEDALEFLNLDPEETEDRTDAESALVSPVSLLRLRLTCRWPV